MVYLEKIEQLFKDTILSASHLDTLPGFLWKEMQHGYISWPATLD